MGWELIGLPTGNDWQMFNSDGEIRIVDGPVVVPDEGTWLYIRLLPTDPVETIRYLQATVVVDVGRYLEWYSRKPPRLAMDNRQFIAPGNRMLCANRGAVC